MEKTLKLYYYIDGENDSLFPNDTFPAILNSFDYNSQRMGDTMPSISATLMYPQCLDALWECRKVYVQFNGEKYFIVKTPSSSYSNEDARYKHELVFESERNVLKSTLFYDVVSDGVNDKPVSNNTNFTFFGDIHQLVQRLNSSLSFAGLSYNVVIDDNITSEEKFVSFNDKFIIDVFKYAFEVFGIPYYFVGRTIHFGYAQNEISKVFKTNINDALLSVAKNNAQNTIITRATGYGSSENLPYYYPNKDPKGTSIALYNNISNIVSIANEQLYKKIKLNDSLNYIDIPPTNLSYNNNYHLPIESVVEIEENLWEIGAIRFPFTITNLSDTFFNLSIGELGKNGSSWIRIYASDGTIVSDTISSGTFSRMYDVGEYELSIRLIFNSSILDGRYDSVSIDNIDEIVNSLISVNVYALITHEVGWFINNSLKKVDLSEYGLLFTGIPTNGDIITFQQTNYLLPQSNLMPSIYRSSQGNERFYDAKNDTYINDDTQDYYEFPNELNNFNRSESIKPYEHIKPTIKGIRNEANLPIDTFIEFAYDTNDNDDIDDEGNYIHPYFFAKLRRFNGEFGFNLFEHAIESGAMTISMTSGNCGACKFEIGVDDSSKKNLVQVDSNGNLIRDDYGNVITFGEPQERQNDTKNYEVWIALKKDINTFGVVMPNVTNDYKPSTNDTFVIINIDLPFEYITNAEKELEKAIIKDMYENNSEQFNFSISFSRIYFAQNPNNILNTLNENSLIHILYNEKVYQLYVSSFKYSMSGDSSDSPLPAISVDLYDSITIRKNIIERNKEEIATLQHTKATKANSLSAYGIKDAKIDKNGNILIGKKQIKPITQEQELKPLIFTINGVQSSSYDPKRGGIIDLTPQTANGGSFEVELNKLRVALQTLLNVIGIDENGNVYIKPKDDNNSRDFYAYGNVSAFGYHEDNDLSIGLLTDWSQEASENDALGALLGKELNDRVSVLEQGGGGSGATTLGGLTNVDTSADDTPSTTKVLVKLSGANLWTLKDLSDIGGGSGGGITEEELASYLTNNNYAKISDIPSLSGYATQTWVQQQEYLTTISKSQVTTALGYTPVNPSSLKSLTIKRNNTTIATYSPTGSVTSVNISVPTTASDVGALPTTTKYAAGDSVGGNANNALKLGGVALGGLFTDFSNGDNGLSITIGSVTKTLQLDLSSDIASALNSWSGSTNISTLGTITSGVWKGSQIAQAYIGNLPISKITNLQTTLDTITSNIENKLDATTFNELFEVVRNSDDSIAYIKAKSSFVSVGNMVAFWSDNSSTGGDDSIALEALSDVLISSPTSGQALVWNGSKWVNSTIETGLNTTELENYLSTRYVKTTTLSSQLTNYVQKVSGKGLSTNDFTNTYKTKLDGLENYNDSDLRELIGGKQATITGAASTITSSNLTANRVLVSNSSGKVAISDITSTELGYLDNLATNVQSHITKFSDMFQLVTNSGVTYVKTKYNFVSEGNVVAYSNSLNTIDAIGSVIAGRINYIPSNSNDTSFYTILKGSATVVWNNTNKIITITHNIGHTNYMVFCSGLTDEGEHFSFGIYKEEDQAIIYANGDMSDKIVCYDFLIIRNDI